MIIAIGVLTVLVCIFAYALCKAASDGDERSKYKE